MHVHMCTYKDMYVCACADMFARVCVQGMYM